MLTFLTVYDASSAVNMCPILILPTVTLSRFLSDIWVDTVRDPVSWTEPLHVITAGSIRQYRDLVSDDATPNRDG